MFLSEREYHSSKIYDKITFVKKEGLPLSIIFSILIFAMKVTEFKKKNLSLNSETILIFFISIFLVLLSGIISAFIRYEIYTDMENKLGKLSYFLQYFINLYLIILSGVVMKFNYDSKTVISLIVATFIVVFIASIITSMALHKTWKNKIILLRKNSKKMR